VVSNLFHTTHRPLTRPDYRWWKLFHTEQS